MESSEDVESRRENIKDTEKLTDNIDEVDFISELMNAPPKKEKKPPKFTVVKKEDIKVNFTDIVGLEEQKRALVETFTDAKRFPQYITEMSGAVLIGPMGCGKTLLGQ